MKKFTLVELMVVIAMISMLMSMLLPSIQKARAKTVAAVCLNNQKQINIGFLMYAADYDNHFVPLMHSGLSNSWQRNLHVNNYLVVPDGKANKKYIKSESKSFIFWCPAESVHGAIGDIGMNSNISGFVDRYSRYNEIINPVTTVLIGDAHAGGTKGAGGWWINSSTWIASGLAITEGGSPYPDEARHMFKAASIFTDGHGEFLKADKVVAERNKLYTGPKDQTNPEYN